MIHSFTYQYAVLRVTVLKTGALESASRCELFTICGFNEQAGYANQAQSPLRL